MADVYVAFGWQKKIDPKTGRTTHCDTSTPWWRKIVNWVAEGVGTAALSYVGVDPKTAKKLTDAGINAIQSETNKLDGHNLRKWFNEAPNVAVMAWGIAHAKLLVDDAQTKTDHDWPARKDAVAAMNVNADNFAGTATDQLAATMKVMMYSFIYGGISWGYARHVIEAILLAIYNPSVLLALLEIIENRKTHRAKVKGALAGQWALDTIALVRAAAASLPSDLKPAADAAQPPAAAGSFFGDLLDKGLAEARKRAPGAAQALVQRYAPNPGDAAIPGDVLAPSGVLDTTPAVAPAVVPPSAPAVADVVPVAAGAGIGDPVYSLKHERWAHVEAVGPSPDGLVYGLRFDDGKAGAALESEIGK